MIDEYSQGASAEVKTEERPKRDVCAMLVNTNGSRKVVKWFAAWKSPQVGRPLVELCQGTKEFS
ncbi:MAG: hypothetical protein ACTS6P_01120 [Candidatus Hodgkinia cicadicola]